MKGIYLCCGYDTVVADNLVYQDKFIKRDLGGDCLDIDLSSFDYILCSPPCNYWSRANYRRDVSVYAINTRDLLPKMLMRLIKLNKPFIVENVRNDNLFRQYGLFDLPCFIYRFRRHTIFTNVLLPYDLIYDYYCGVDLQHFSTKMRQGDISVTTIFQDFINLIGGNSYDKFYKRYN